MSPDDIRKKKIAELQERALREQAQAEQEEVQLQQQIHQLEQAVRHYLSKDALIRYHTLKTAHPEKAIKVLVSLFQLIQQGSLRESITDMQFRDFLYQFDSPKRKSSIKRV